MVEGSLRSAPVGGGRPSKRGLVCHIAGRRRRTGITIGVSCPAAGGDAARRPRGVCVHCGRRAPTPGRGSGSGVTIPFDALQQFNGPGVFNPWAERDPLDIGGGGPAARLGRLRRHFDVDPLLILIGEAAGYQGCHFSGMAFTNERLMLEGRIPRIAVDGRFTARPRPWCEPSATVVWGALHAHGVADRTVLWNSFAWHPYKDGNPYSNRAPTRTELEAGRAVLDGVLGAFAGACVVAVGQVAGRTLRSLGREPAAVVRHPSMGGANEFRAGLGALVAGLRRP